MENETPKIQGLAVTLSGEGRGNGKKPTWVWGGAAEEWGERDEGWDEISA